MPSRYEREGQFGPSDWMNIANSVNSITNSIVKSENQGLVREDQTKKKKLLDATNKAATAMQLGISPEDARTQVNEQTEYDDPGWWGKLTGEEGKTVKSFDPITAETGYQNALTLRGASGKATTDKYVNDYKNQFASLSIKDISNTDFSKQKNPLAARMAAGQMLSLYGKTKEAETRSYAAQEKIGEQMYTQFAGGISEAETLLGKGDAKVSRDIILKLIKEGNNTPYKATADGDGIRMFITYDGEDAKDEKILSIPQALSELKNISKVKYIDTYHKNATFHRKLNEETAANPKRLVNKYGDVIQAISRSEPLTNKVEWDVFDKKGNQLPITDLADARKKGYFNAPTGKSAGKGSGKTIDKGKQFDALSKRIGNTVEMMVKNNPAKWATDGEGGYIDVTTNQAAGNAPYAAALLNQMQSGLITKEDAAQYAAAVGITPQDMQIAAGVAGSGGKHGEIKGAILGTTPISADEQARRGEKTAQQKKNSPFALDRNTWTKPLVEKVKPLFQGNTMPIIDDPYAR